MQFKFINRSPVEYVQFRITPDRTVDNKKVHDLFRAVSTFYASPLDVMRGKKVPGAFWWDVMLGAESIKFYCTVPADWKKEIRSQLESTWPCSAVELLDRFETAVPESSDVCEMKYRRNNFFALQTDRRVELEPLRSILATSDEMEFGDMARLSICADPVSRIDWQDYAERQYRTFKGGSTPRRTRLSKRDLFVSIGEFITGLLQSALDTVHLATGDAPKQEKIDDYEKRKIMIDGVLSKGTLNKLRAPTFNTFIRIASHSDDKGRQRVILRTLSNTFNDLTAENELEREDIHEKLKPIVIRELNTYRISWPTRLDWDKNVMSNEELGRLVELPTAALQDVYTDMETLNSRQIEVPKSLSSGGLPFGSVQFKKEEKTVFIPTRDLDQLCLPTVVMGGMGSGKTKGFGCNRAIRFVEIGYSSIIIDPAKSEVWGIVEKALPKEKRKRILLGHDIISLDFREAMRSQSGKARLAQIMFAFFDTNTDEAGAQTQRFLRAAVMGMRTGRLAEIVKIFRDKKYLQETINQMTKDSMHRITLQEFHDYTKERQAQIVAPIFNRLDVILGDPYLEKCMNTESGIDMVEILSKRGVCTVFDAPDRLNTREGKDLLINLISFKIDAAMGLRAEEFPVAIIYDEPHQYLRSAKLWKNVAVEARKYRLSYTWLFHSWEQIPKDLAQIIKDAGPHFFLYPSSKQTYKGLQEEIAPFTVEDGLNTKRFHAICALKFGDSRLTPFMAKMDAPLL